MGPALLLLAQAIAWQWTSATPPTGMYAAPRTARLGAIECSFAYDGKAYKARTSCGQNGRELWRVVEPDAFVADAALVIDGGTLYSARFSDISTGCTVHAFDALTGRERWSVNLVGMGRIAHSEYYNLVQTRAGNGQLVVFGWEAAGRYIEVRDTTTGVMLSHQVVP
jgi:outer membrane protein assembly factor BamB